MKKWRRSEINSDAILYAHLVGLIDKREEEAQHCGQIRHTCMKRGGMTAMCVCVWVLWRFASRNGCVRTFYTSVVSPNSGGHAGKLTSSPHIYFQHRIFSQNAIRCRCLILTGKVSCVFSAGFHRGSPLPVPKVELRQREMLFRSL